MDIKRLGLEDDDDDDDAIGDPVMEEWREERRRASPEYQKLGGPIHSRERSKLSYIDRERDDRGSRIPLAEEDDDTSAD
jgi:hypothetical protein